MGFGECLRACNSLEPLYLEPNMICKCVGWRLLLPKVKVRMRAAKLIFLCCALRRLDPLINRLNPKTQT